MLVLTRKVGDTIYINEEIEVVITEVKGDQVKVGIRAPRHVDIIRGELRKDISDSNTEAAVKNLALLDKFK